MKSCSVANIIANNTMGPAMPKIGILQQDQPTNKISQKFTKKKLFNYYLLQNSMIQIYSR